MIDLSITKKHFKSTDDWQVTITSNLPIFVYSRDSEFLAIASSLDLLMLSVMPSPIEDVYLSNTCDVIIGGRVTAEKFIEDIQKQAAVLKHPFLDPIENALLVEIGATP